MVSFARGLFCALLFLICLPGLPVGAQSPEPASDSAEEAVAEALALMEKDNLPLETRLGVAKALVERHPAQAELWAVLGEMREQAGQDEAALLAFRRAVELDDELHSSWHWIGILEKRLAFDSEGLERALAAFRTALDRGAPRAPGLNEMAVTLVNLGRVDDAVALWEEAIDVDPSWGVLYANLVKAKLMEGDEDEALEWARRSLGAERFESQAVLLLGAFFLKEGDEDEALDLYRMALGAHPEDPRFRYEFAATLVEEGRDAPALAQFRLAREHAIEQGDESTAAAARLNIFALQYPDDHERMLKAEELQREAIERPDRADRKNGEIVELTSKIIAAHPTLWEAALMRGAARRQLGQYEAAGLDFQRVLDEAPGQANALINLALLRRDQGDLAAATKFATDASSAAPNDPFIQMNAAFVFADTGNCKTALEIRQSLATRFPPGSIDDLLATLDERLKEAGCLP